MQVVFLADTHAGVRNNSPVFMKHQIRFFEETFFPFVEEHGIEHMVHLGDVFDRRKDTNNFAVYEWDKRVFARWAGVFKHTHIIIGNHDTYFKNTNSVNTPEKFLSHYENITFYSSPVEVDFYGIPTLVLPWICEENQEQAKKLLEGSEAELVFGHLEIIGCPMFRGIENTDKGFEQSIFSKFKQVFSGHFHLKSTQKNIQYLGSPTATMWAEAFDPRGFHVFDTETRKLTFVPNPHNPFALIEYCGTTPTEIPDVKDKVVRVLVKQKGSETDFIRFVEAIEEGGPAEVQVTEQQAISTFEGSVDENLDMFSLIDLYVDGLSIDSSKEELKSVLRELYHEAIHLHDISE